MNFLTTIVKNKINIVEIPIDTLYIDNNIGSHFKPIKDSIIIVTNLLKYSLSSVISSILDLGMFTIFNEFVFTYSGNSLFLSTIIARISSTLFNFSINKKFIFNEKNYTVKNQFAKYILLAIFQMIASGVLVSLLSSIYHNPTLIKLFVDVSLFLLSYPIQKIFIFH